MFRYILLILPIFLVGGEIAMEKWENRIKDLTPQEKHILIDKGTEAPFSGALLENKQDGIYRCKLCGSALFESKSKFNSHTGWPSFDDAIPNAVKEIPDKDGRRTEIVCANCGGHLGHVFRGEGFTSKNTRHCVNSLSLSFDKQDVNTSLYKEAYFAGGCFWGVEYYFEKLNGVKEAISGYMGGKTKNPTYREVCNGNTEHLEVVKVVYNPQEIDYASLAKLFFEIHDPTQTNGQGPDIGSQYLSAIFVNDEKEKEVIKKLILQLEEKGYKVATKIFDYSPFYEAEEYHQDYYFKHNKQPYCHTRIKRFD
ncbi:MAG TPA: bifunctional methionine sulfoxide reductase B/A protein [Epsilonproteobacteria bacterium]|nr:bifunctional methionine sulfoxide reductase B/A protein [Campylobacterota bacterium]